MTGWAGVRTHTRRTASGRSTTVRQHARRTQGRGVVRPRHAWTLIVRAWRAARRNRRGLAAGFVLLAALELAAWLTLNGAALVLATAGLLALGGAAGAAALTGMRARP